MVTSTLNRQVEIFEFLKRNTKWNEAFQSDEYRRELRHCRSAKERLTQLLHSTVNSQTKANMTFLGDFWRSLHVAKRDSVDSLFKFTAHLESQHPPKVAGIGPWDRLFHALKAQRGWGDKTAALFVKSTIRIHRGPQRLHFWTDAHRLATAPITSDKVYLPVDAVIKHVFKEIGFERPDFWPINRGLLATYSPEDILVWDDLWFWGFFTQSSKGGNRTPGWNSDKYWGQLGSQKEEETTVQRLGERFLRLARQSG